MARRDRRDSDEEPRDVQRAILDTTERLLAERRFDELSVSDILAGAGVSRASFYFYFESKHAVLAELVRAAIATAREISQPWLDHGRDESPRELLRRGIADGAQLWRDHAPVLRAIVENWHSDPGLAELWAELMDGLTTVAAQRIEQDRRDGLAPAVAVDPRTLAALLNWMAERTYYLAACGIAPFDDEEGLIDGLTEVWTAAVYGDRPARA